MINDTPITNINSNTWDKLRGNITETTELDEDGPVGELDLSEEEMSAPGVVEALVAEIQEYAARAVEYKQERDTAKTKLKEQHFNKKLIKNNEIAATLIVALEKVIKAREAREPIADAQGATDQDGTRKESPI